MFDFKPGIDPPSASNAAQQHINELNNAKTPMNLDDGLRAYIRTTDALEAWLRSILEDQDWLEVLHAPGYWAICSSVHLQAHQATGLLLAEGNRLVFWMNQLKSELDKMAAEDDRADLTAVRLVMDSSALLRARSFDEVEWTDYFDRSPVRLILPILVVSELDGRKNRGDKRARTRLRKIRETLEGHDQGPAHVRGGVTLELLLDPPRHDRLSINDEEIVRRADSLNGRKGGQLYIVTGDYTMQFTAEADGLKVFFLPEGLRLEPPAASAE